MHVLVRGVSVSLLALVIIGIDQYTKAYTAQNIPVINAYDLVYPYNGIGVFENFLGIEFSISHVENRGAAWGAFSDHQVTLIYLRLALIVGLICYAVCSTKAKQWRIPLALIIGGASSNALDYFVYGHVIDMLHAVFWGYDFPVFNIADSSVFIGVTWISLSTFYTTKQETHDK